ncbi:MAG: CARDB domain-containing protein, partial [Phycisphaerae bacterium]
MRYASPLWVSLIVLVRLGFAASASAADAVRTPLLLMSCAVEVLAAPTAADLDVTCIERTPRYDYDAAKNNPAPGDVVTFSGHVRNTGTVTVSADYRWDLDGAPVAGGTLTSVPPGQERVVSWPWTWQSGNHRIRLAVDPNNLIAETSEANNSIEDRTNAIIVGFWVEQSVYNYFRSFQSQLAGVGSVSWEDWAQRQMRFWNQFCENAIYPTTPDGVLDRVRIDKIVIVPDGALPLNGGLPTNHPDLSDKTVDLMWGFPASLLSGGMYNDHTSVSMSNPFYYEGSLLHELGHARYLIDTYGLDVHNTVTCCGGYDSVQIYEGPTYVGGSAYMPYIAFGEVLYYNKYDKMMSGGYDQGWSEYDAGALNRIAGRRATCGNYNAPCNIGEFLQDLPANNHIRFTDQYGRPRPGADVRVYRATGGPGWYGKTFDNIPDL